MDMDLLPTLVAVADAGGLSAAGRRIGLSQPAVHQQLARLAEQVGRPLYRRDGRRIVLTETGEHLVALGRRVDADAQATLAHLRGEPAARPTVCAGPGVWRYLVHHLPPCRPLVADGPGTVAAVREGRAVLGIAAGSPPEGLDHRAVATVGLRLVGSEGPWVLPPRGRPLRELVEARWGPCDVAVEVEGWDLLLRFVTLGRYRTVLNAFVPVPDDVPTAPFPDAPPVVYRAFWHPTSTVDPLLEALFPT